MYLYRHDVNAHPEGRSPLQASRVVETLGNATQEPDKFRALNYDKKRLHLDTHDQHDLG